MKATDADFLTEDQRMIRDTARDFAQGELAPHATRWDEEGWVPDDVVAKLADLGFLGMTVSPEWGGSGADYLSYILAIEEIAAGCAATSTVMCVHNGLGCGIVQAWGSEAQKREWLPAMAAGKAIACFCLTEPQAGSEANNLKTRAAPVPEGWVLEGAKQFISNAKRARIGVVFAATDPDLGKRGLSAFLVPTNTPGFHVQRPEKKLGLRALDTCAIAIQDCRLPPESLLGPRGKGLAIALSNLEAGRIGIAAQACGIARSALQAALSYAKERTQFGRKIVEHQSIANLLADMHTQLNAARLMVLHAARLRSAGIPCLSEASQAKLFASEAAEQICSKAIQVHGGYGYVRDYPVERHYRDVRVTQIYEGTSEIQRMLIARSLAE